MRKLLFLCLCLPGLCHAMSTSQESTFSIVDAYASDTRLVDHIANQENSPLIKRLITHGSRLLAIPEPTVCVSIFDAPFCAATRQSNPPVIFVYPSFEDLPYPKKKLVLFHELYHCLQKRTVGLNGPINPSKYPRGRDQEADLQSILMANCPSCAHDIVGFSPDSEQEYASSLEIAALAETLKDSPLCPYHRIVSNRPTYRLSSLVYHVAKKICPESFLTHERMNQATPDSILGFLRVAGLWAISIPAQNNKLFFSFANRWIGRDVEEKIAKGELDV